MTEKFNLREQVVEAGFDGVSTGIFIALIVEILYVVGFIVMVSIFIVLTQGFGLFYRIDILSRIVNGLIPYLSILLTSTLVGAIPAIFVGIITGFLLGSSIMALYKKLTIKLSMLYGFLFGLVVSVILFGKFGSLEDYWFIVGGPSILYTLACGWMSGVFFQDRVMVFTLSDEPGY